MGVWKCFTAVTVVVYLITATSALNYDHGAATRARRNADTDDTLIFDSLPLEVELNKTAPLNCGVKLGTTNYECTWESEKGEIVQVHDVYSGDVYATYSKPENLTDNQCGIVIDAVQLNQIQRWTCIVYLNDKQLSASRTLELRRDPVPDPPSDSDDSLGGGAIAGIVIGVLLGVGLLIGVVIGVLRLNK